MTPPLGYCSTTFGSVSFSRYTFFFFSQKVIGFSVWICTVPFDSPQILDVVSRYCNVISEIVSLACIGARVIACLSPQSFLLRWYSF